MRITYDKDLKIAGVGMVPWRRLGPEQWFPKYAIASLYGNGGVEFGPLTVSLSDDNQVREIPRRNTMTLLQDDHFQQIVDTELPGYDLMLYRATDIPEAFANRKILMADETLVRMYENKVQFREAMGDYAPFAPYKIVEKAELLHDEATFKSLMAGRTGMVLQDARLSGGQGTFIIRDYTSYVNAVTTLEQNAINDDPTVISDLLVDTAELSIQVCITSSGTFTGPLQRQIIREPALYMDIPGASGFCGIQILSADQGTETHQKAIAIAQDVAIVLQESGYRGIFGIDLLQTTDGTVYLLEANPRITGATPLLSALYRGEEGVPFYLLHILELGDYTYEITDATTSFEAQEGALLVVHSQFNRPLSIASLPKAGTYTVSNGAIKRLSDNLRLDTIGADEFILLPQTQVGGITRPGGMLCSLLFNGQKFDPHTNRLHADVSQLITLVRNEITWHE